MLGIRPLSLIVFEFTYKAPVFKMSFTNIDERIFRQTKLAIARNLFDVEIPDRISSYDRFIPYRANNSWETSFATIPDPNRGVQTGKKARETGENVRDSSVYNILLRNEILGENIEDVKSQCDERQALTPVKSRNLFKYGTPTKVSCPNNYHKTDGAFGSLHVGAHFTSVLQVRVF